MRPIILNACKTTQCRLAFLALSVALMALAGFAAGETALLSVSQGWSLPEGFAQGRLPSETGRLEVRGLGELAFEPADIETLRPDLFLPGHFSVFDVLVHLAEAGAFEMTYVFNEELDTYVIQTLRGLAGWWYDAHYEGGSFDKTVVRMDHFPVKDGMESVLYLENPTRLDAIYEHYREEVARRNASDGQITIPLVTLQSATQSVEFRDVTVTAHNARADVFQDGVITLIDVLLSLGDQEALDELGLDWRASEEDIALVDGYYVVAISADGFNPAVTGTCVLTHQISGAAIAEYLSPHTHTMSHIHLTADLEVLISPESVEWLWICL